MQPNATNERENSRRSTEYELNRDVEVVRDNGPLSAESWNINRRTFMKAGTLLGAMGGALAQIPSSAAGQDVSNIWNEQHQLLASDGAAMDAFGTSVSFSSDGNTALISATGDDDNGPYSGSAYVFVRSGEVWIEQDKLVASDGTENDSFGFSTALSSDGNTALVGSYRSRNEVGDQEGAAYVFTRAEGTWSEQQRLTTPDVTYLDYFGASVALSSDGNTALVGGILDDNENGDNAGAAHIFTRSGGTWSEQQKLLASDGSSGDEFGQGVALSDDGNTALIGAKGNDNENGSYAGAVYVFTYSDGLWNEEKKLLAPNESSYSLFGYSIALSSDGNTALVGAPRDDNVNGRAGGAYLFIRTGEVWNHQKRFIASDGDDQDQFGREVALSDDGNTALIGAYNNSNESGNDAGAVFVFTRSGEMWSEQEKLIENSIGTSDDFGYAVAIDSMGDTALIGQRHDYNRGMDRAGAAYIFTRSDASPPNLPPIAAFEYMPDIPEVDEKITFDASASTDPDGEEPLSYEWAFGDGTTGTGQQTTHTYTTEGDYEATLTVTDEAGAAATDTQNVLVVPVPNQSPNAAFEYSPSAPEIGEEVTFDASDSTDPDEEETLAYEWDFGDATTETGQIATHTYADDGDYDVTLTVTDEADATDEETQTVSVAPAALFADPLRIKGRKYQPQDLDGDGLYEDLNGDGRVTGRDTAALAHIIGANRKGDVNLTERQIVALDFNGDGRLTGADMGAYNRIRKGRRNGR